MKRILLVDDNESFRKPLGLALQFAGYEVQTAPEGGAAIRLYTENPFDLVITDLVMPGKEGLETIIELHKIEPGLKIIAISGGGRMNPGVYLPMAAHLGAVATLAKPFTAKTILDLVAEQFCEPQPIPLH